MFFKSAPLRHQIIQLIVNNKAPYRNTQVKGFFMIVCVILFFQRYKSVILNDLYYKGLIELQGDVALFIRAKTVWSVKHLHIAASITQKGMVYYKLYIEEAGPELMQDLASQKAQRQKLSVVR